MNILGIDFGTKRIGLAWMQKGLDVILPYGVVTGEELPAFVKKEKIDLLVVGLPLGAEGEENPNTKRVRAFAENLKKETGLPVEFVDERYTTHEANTMGGGASLDEKAAMLILESYLAELSDK
ncbi:MAG: Holliday junction resolvase RuvX [Patescibacteria group bacterium]